MDFDLGGAIESASVTDRWSCWGQTLAQGLTLIHLKGSTASTPTTSVRPLVSVTLGIIHPTGSLRQM